MGINNEDEIVGAVDSVDEFFDLTALEGFIRTPGGSILTYRYPGSAFTDLIAVNDLGTVLGDSYDEFFTSHQFLLQRDGTVKDLSVPGYELVFWSKLNNAGTLIGSEFNPATGRIEGLTTDGATVQSFVVPGASDTFPFDINNRGEISGYFDIHSPDFSTFEVHGFVRDAKGNASQVDYSAPWAPTKNFGGITADFLKDLGTTVLLTNDKGDIVGNDAAMYVYINLPNVFIFIDQVNFVASPRGNGP